MKRAVWMLLSKVVVGSGVTCNKSILKPQNKRNPPPPPKKKKFLKFQEMVFPCSNI